MEAIENSYNFILVGIFLVPNTCILNWIILSFWIECVVFIVADDYYTVLYIIGFSILLVILQAKPDR